MERTRTTRESRSDDDAVAPHASLIAFCTVAAYYRIPADPTQLARELSLVASPATNEDILAAAQFTGLKARIVAITDVRRFETIPSPAIMRQKSGNYAIFAGLQPSGNFRFVDPATRASRELSGEDILRQFEPAIILIARRLGGPGVTPQMFSFKWFLPSIWRYRRPLGHVLLASFFVQLFALVTPLFFQVVIDKVLSHRAYDTLYVMVAALLVIGVFDVVLQYLRTYALSHTTNRIDVELGRRLLIFI